MLSLLLTLAVVILIAGLIIYLVNLAPAPSWIKQAFTAVAVVIILIWLIMEIRKYLPAGG